MKVRWSEFKRMLNQFKAIIANAAMARRGMILVEQYPFTEISAAPELNTRSSLNCLRSDA